MSEAANHLSGNIAAAQSVTIQGAAAADTSVTAANGFNNAGTIEFDSNGGSTAAKLTVTNGTLNNTGVINVNQGTGGNRIVEGDLFNEGFVTLSLGNGQAFIINSSSFENGIAGIIKGVGRLDVSSTSFINAGAIGPGLSPGILELTGDYLQTPTGVFSVEIDRHLPAGNDFDRLLVSGQTMLTGTLNISVTQTMTNPFNTGDRFQVLTCHPCSGLFGPVKGLEIGNGLRLEPIYNPTSLTLEVRPGMLEPITDTLYLPFITK
jgi:hypothetical protein